MKQHIQLMSAIRGHVAGYGWAVSWFCGALGVSRSGFHAWLVRAPLARAQSDDAVSRKIKASFTLSDRTYSRPSRSNESAGKSIGHAIRPRLTCSIISSVSTIPPAGTRRWAMSVLSTSNARRGGLKKLISVSGKPAAGQMSALLTNLAVRHHAWDRQKRLHAWPKESSG
jgi:hypothetical protein